MDIKETVEELVKKITSDKDGVKKFQDNAEDVVKKYLPAVKDNEQIKAIVDAVSAKIKVDALKDKLEDSGIMDKVSGLFGKKD